MRVAIALTVLVALTGCGSGGKKTGGPGTLQERCTQRFLARAGGDKAQVRSYIERTYCGPFAQKGWVYPDGTLSIKAQLWSQQAGSCATGKPGQPPRMTPCRPSVNPLDCALLHFVRKDEAQAYLAKLRRSHKVSCDDGTPLAQLGA